MNETPSTLYASVAGTVLTFSGIIGFFYSSSFGSPGEVDSVFGVFAINGWHNLLHIATGLLGLLAYTSGPAASRQCALGLGVFYVIVAIWGFATGDGNSILGFIPVNTEDNVLHALVGLAGLAAFYATRGTERAVTT